MNPHVYHRVLLWRGQPVVVTPDKRQSVERVWQGADQNDVIEINGTKTVASNIVGFEETRDQLPSSAPALPAPELSDEERARGRVAAATVRQKLGRKLGWPSKNGHQQSSEKS